MLAQLLNSENNDLVTFDLLEPQLTYSGRRVSLNSANVPQTVVDSPYWQKTDGKTITLRFYVRTAIRSVLGKLEAMKSPTDNGGLPIVILQLGNFDPINGILTASEATLDLKSVTGDEFQAGLVSITVQEVSEDAIV